MDVKHEGLYVPEVNSKWEPLILKKVCEPTLRVLPRWVSPNSISIFNHFVAWMAFIAAVGAPYLSPGYALIARCFAGFAFFSSMILDCLDGMQARRTNRCSKLGEVLDHWLDAINVPLCAAGLILTLGLGPWLTAVCIATTALVYHAQLVLYHHSGRFVTPPTSGMDGQLMVAACFPLVGVLFFFFPRDLYWTNVMVLAFGSLVGLFQIKLAAFYWVRIRRWFKPHLFMAAMCLGFGVLHLKGMINEITLVLLVSAVSFRITGSYVLNTVLKRPYNGFDWMTLVWLLMIPTLNWVVEPVIIRGVSVQSLLPYIAFAQLTTANVMELFRDIPQLRPEPSSTVSLRSIV